MDSVTRIREHAFRSLENSLFFRDLCAGVLPRPALNEILGQYYFYRKALHKEVLRRWFGQCIEKNLSRADRKARDRAAVFDVLCRRIPEAINSLDLFKRFLSAAGIDARTLRIDAPAKRYIENFRERVAGTDFPPTCAAYAAHELLLSLQGNLCQIALQHRYGIEDLGFWGAHSEPGETYFRQLWAPLARLERNEPPLLSAAMDEIDWHVGFWDELRNHCVAQAA